MGNELLRSPCEGLGLRFSSVHSYESSEERARTRAVSIFLCCPWDGAGPSSSAAKAVRVDSSLNAAVNRCATQKPRCGAFRCRGLSGGTGHGGTDGTYPISRGSHNTLTVRQLWKILQDLLEGAPTSLESELNSAALNQLYLLPNCTYIIVTMPLTSMLFSRFSVDTF